MKNIISALDFISGGKTESEVIFGEISKPEVFLSPDADFELGRFVGIFPCMPPSSDPSVPFYYHLNEPNDNEYIVAVLWNGKKYQLQFGKDPQGEFTLSGLEEGLRPIQVNIFKMSEHNYRMYFWAHFHGTPRKVRMLIAESSDNHHWQIINNGRPAFCHYSDCMCQEGLFPVSRQCNDATALYRRSDGTFEVISASLIHLDANSNTRYYQKDIWRGYVRVIQRWTGDGLEDWSQPEIIVLPDEEDPIDLQMYYLCVNELPHGNFGWLGRYSALKQSMSMEPVWSRDRRQWLRPLRGSYGPDSDYIITAAAHHMAEIGDKFRLYYSRSNGDHNFKTANGGSVIHEICYADMDKHRLFGRNMNNTVLLSPPLRMVDTSLQLYSSDDAELQFIWRNAFGEVSGKEVKAFKVSPSLWQIDLQDCKKGCTGRLEICGKGKVFDLKY